MSTDEEKSKLSKLLQSINVPETRLTERCAPLIKEFHKRFDKEVEEEDRQYAIENEVYENPYRPDRDLLEENERKLRELLSGSKKIKKEVSETVVLNTADPKRPWRTNSNKEKLHRIDTELKQHLERSTQLIVPMTEGDMKDLVNKCQEETKAKPPVGIDRLRATVEFAQKNLPNFQYRKIANSTATAIMTSAHNANPKSSNENETV